ncbi:MAG TPA: helix-turn-helix transcriptional regulator [Vitreimonas sp.]|nr:helix-turn-helix transcriptional regulator [Vitreimonas sp.]
MAGTRRTNQAIAGQLEASRLALTLGREVRDGRLIARLTQEQLGRRVGLGRSRISDIERGRGATLPLGTWVALGSAVGRPMAVSLTRPINHAAPGDAGHLDIQEGLVQLLARHGYVAMVELATRPLDPAHSIDVAARDADHHYLLLEGWNRFGDLGASIRSTDRKTAELRSLAADADVRVCWIVRATAANRALLRRYPGILRSRFPASSRAWARALHEGGEPPRQPGIVWWADGRAVPVRWS